MASEKYMSDSTGRIITPKITPAFSGDGNVAGLEQQRRLELAARRITNLRGSRLENEMLLQQFEEQRRIIGPGLERSGCVMVTDALRRGFCDDEDFETKLESDDSD